MSHDKFIISRRVFTAVAASTVAFGTNTLAQSDTALEEDLRNEKNIEPSARIERNISAFSTREWHPYFRNLNNGAILVDTKSRVLHYWSENQSIYKLYPTSVPATPELTKLGRTSITFKKVGPSWSPTASMLKRNPDWPPYVPPGPENPLGTHAMHLTWRYYRIHGTHDTRKIGRRSSNGCIGLYNHHISELFSLCKIGTQVLLI